MVRCVKFLTLSATALILLTCPALAQEQPRRDEALARKITVTRTQNGKITATWPWLTRASYQRAVNLFSLDPIIPVGMAAIINDATDQIEIHETAADGTRLRTYTLANGAYRYTYYLYTTNYYDDTEEVLALLGHLLPLLPDVKDGAPPPLTLTASIKGQLRTVAIEDPKTIKMILDAVKRCHPLNQIDAMRIENNFTSPDAVHILARPDMIDWPSELVFDQFQIKTIVTQPNTHLSEDRQNIWDEALRQKAMYDTAVKHGITNPRPVN